MQRYDLAFDWRGFELHPEIPPGGIDITQMFPKPQVDAMHARLQAVADELGVPFSPRAHAPSTKKALALSEHARRLGRLDAWRTQAMDAHWRDGRDLEAPEVLRDLAERAGLDPDEALAFLEAAEVPALLDAQREEAWRWGVTGIPTWFLIPEDRGARPVRVVGCQPRDVVERALLMVGAQAR